MPEYLHKNPGFVFIVAKISRHPPRSLNNYMNIIIIRIIVLWQIIEMDTMVLMMNQR